MTTKIVLAASLAVNLIVIGFLVGAGFSGARIMREGDHGRFRHEAHDGPPSSMRSFLSELPDERRAELRRQLFERMRDFRNLLDQTSAQREAVREALTSTPFSAEALEAALNDKLEAENALRVKSNQAFAEFAAGLSDEERSDIAAFMEGGPFMGGPDHRERRMWRKPPPGDAPPPPMNDGPPPAGYDGPPTD